jgi:DNA-binding transcriptional LysR family regulator
METENVEIIKAMVRSGLGISIVPWQAVAGDVRAKQLFVSRIAGIRSSGSSDGSIRK